MLSNAVGLDAELFYNVRNQDDDLMDTRAEVFGFAIGFSAFLF